MLVRIEKVHVRLLANADVDCLLIRGCWCVLTTLYDILPSDLRTGQIKNISRNNIFQIKLCTGEF